MGTVLKRFGLVFIAAAVLGGCSGLYDADGGWSLTQIMEWLS
jgi:hypothetical protein